MLAAFPLSPALVADREVSCIPLPSTALPPSPCRCCCGYLAAGAGAGEPATPAARVIYPVDYTAHKVRVFEEVEWPLITPPPAGAPLARRYCADGQARLLLPRIEGDRLRAKLTVSASDGHQEQATPTTPQRAHILRQLLQRHPEPVPRFSSNGAELINPTELMRLRKDLAPLLGDLLALQLVKNSDNQVSLNPTLYCPPAKSSPPDA